MKHASLVLLLGLAACTDVSAPPASPLARARAHHSVVTPSGVIYTASALGSVGGPLGSSTAINDNGQVAGYSYGANYFYFHAFRWQSGVFTDLGTLGGSDSYAYAMNSSGVVAGMATTLQNVQHAVVWNGTTITDLGVLPGYDISLASVINDQGVVGGVNLGQSGNSAFRWENGVMTTLPTLGGTTSDVKAINNQGDMVGLAYATGNTDLRAVLWRNGVVTDLVASLGTTTRLSWAVDINDAGQVIGVFFDAFGGPHAFRWENGTLTDMGMANGSAWFPAAINSSGDVVGSTNGFSGHAVRWRAGTVTDLGTLGGQQAIALDINDAGQIVGLDNSTDGFQRVFLWENGAMTDLGTLGGNISFAQTKSTINNRGQVAGMSEEADLVTRSPTLWDPSNPVLAVVVDIKPGSTPNPINPKSKGLIPVAVLSLGGFDATKIDALSVRFGPGQAVEAHGKGHVEDANGDGVLDLVLHFDTQASGIICGGTSATLTGQTMGGQKISGSDAVMTVGCK